MLNRSISFEIDINNCSHLKNAFYATIEQKKKKKIFNAHVNYLVKDNFGHKFLCLCHL